LELVVLESVLEGVTPAGYGTVTLGVQTGIEVSVVVPARHVTSELMECLAALERQSLSDDRFEVIVSLDHGTSHPDEQIPGTSRATVVREQGTGAAAARNNGVRAARGRWVAFTDADCLPARTWLAALLSAVEAPGELDRTPLGAAGQVVGYRSDTSAARYVDLTSGLDARRHLSHPRFPWAPTANVLYAREALLEVGGFDPRFVTYEGCDLHTRLRRQVGGPFLLEPRAVVFHRHRRGWRRYWRQQLAYGRGYAQFVRAYRDEVPWPISREIRSWIRVAGLAAGAVVPAHSSDARLVRRGTFIKDMAQRIGFATTYWSRRARRRWAVTVVESTAAERDIGTGGQ
jgi:GT2 family glycosyltransferase